MSVDFFGLFGFTVGSNLLMLKHPVIRDPSGAVLLSLADGQGFSEKAFRSRCLSSFFLGFFNACLRNLQKGRAGRVM